MKDSSTPEKSHRRNSVLLLLVGFIAGTGAGIAVSTGAFSRGGEPEVEAQVEEVVRIPEGTAGSSKAPVSDPLSRLLNPFNADGLDKTRELIAFVDAAKPGELEARLNEIFARRKGHHGYDLINSLYEKWVKTDPAAAVRHAVSQNGRHRDSAMIAVLSAWAEREPEEVIAWATGHESPKESDMGYRYAIEKIAKQDPLRALEWVKQNPKPGIELSISRVLSTWAQTDPISAAAHALSSENFFERLNNLGSVASVWAQSNPEEAWAWASALEGDRERGAAQQGVVAEVVDFGETDAAVALLEEMPANQGRRDALNRLASNLAYQDPEKAFELVKRLAKDNGDEDSFDEVFSRWSQTDPDLVFDIATHQLPPGNAQISGVFSALDVIATRDPERALRMLAGLNFDTQDVIMNSLSKTLAKADRELTLKWAEGLSNGDRKEEILSGILGEWARVDPLQAVSYGLKIENQSLRSRSLGPALEQWGQSDAISAMTWAVENLDDKDQTEQIPRILGNWANEEVEAAAKWVSSLPAGELRESSIYSLVSSWARRDFEAAGNWLKAVPKGRGRDGAAAEYAWIVYRTDPEAALVWAGSIEDETNRLDTVTPLVERYLKHEPEKARRWIANSSLPEEKKETLLKQP